MPEGRMLKKAICRSRKMGDLPTDSARLLYVLMLPHLDIEGRLEADPYLIKGLIVPRLKDWDIPKIESCLAELVKCKMILLYQNDGDRYLQYTKFKSHQKLYPSKEAPSQIPKPPKKNDTNSEQNQEDEPITPELIEATTAKLPASKVKESKGKESKSTDPEVFNLPSKEEISESSTPKIKIDLEKMCDALYEKKIFVKVHAFKNTMLKKGKNERAILHTLSRCFIKSENAPFKTEKEPWAYCEKIIQVENGNFNERDHLKTTETSP